MRTSIIAFERRLCDHLLHWRDRGRLWSRDDELFEARVRRILDTAAERAETLHGPYSTDEWLELVLGTIEQPRIWVGVVVSTRRISISIQYCVILNHAEYRLVNRLEKQFIREYAPPVAVCSSSAPCYHAFRRHDA